MLAVVGQSVAYLLAVTRARQLGVDGFEAYAVASAAFTLMVMYTPRGLEKYALRLLPALFARGDWGRPGGTCASDCGELSAHRYCWGPWSIYFSLLLITF